MSNGIMKLATGLPALIVLGALAVSAQPPPGPGGDQPGPPERQDWGREPGPGFRGGPGMRDGRGVRGPRRGGLGPGSRWWMNARVAERVGLTDDQKQRMDAIFQQSRLKLIDLHASLQKEEAILEPLMSADAPDEAKVLPQIDRVVQARGELEKARARMLLGIRGVLTPEQWKKLKTDMPPGRPQAGGRPQQMGGRQQQPRPLR